MLILTLYVRAGNVNDGVVGLYPCHHTGGNQAWSLTKEGFIKHHDTCLTIVNEMPGTEVLMRKCENSSDQVSFEPALTNIII